jgi:hypothetical protein
MSNCDNSIFLFEQLNNPESTIDICPDDVTQDMLLKELMCKDLEAISEETINKNMLWKLFYYNNKSSNNPFGFTFMNGEISIPIVTEPLQTKLSTSRSMKQTTNTKRMTSTKRVNKKKGLFNFFGKDNTIDTNNTFDKNNPYGKNNTRKQRRRRLWFGGNGRYGGNENNKSAYISLLNESIVGPKEEQTFDNFKPVWRFGKTGNAFHTLSKLKNVEGIQLFVHATSLPIKNSFESPKSLGINQYCANTLFFYKYVKNIKRIISLQGCGLDWNLISLPTNIILPFTPSNCQDLDEKRNWDNVSKSDDSQYNDRQSLLLEYYWVDMTSGFFDTYESIVSLDYTNPELKTIIHCYAGYGRTGITLLMILCKYFYSSVNKQKAFGRIFNKQPLAIQDKRNQSSSMCNVLMNILYTYMELDTLSDDSSGLNEECIREINSSISKFDIIAVIRELFYAWTHQENGQTIISLTAMNMLITRINYVIYFTAYINNIPQVNLYQLYNMTTITPHLSLINDVNKFEFLLLNPIQVKVRPFTRSLNHPNTSTYLGINIIQPTHNYVAPPQTTYDYSDDPKGDERLSSSLNHPVPDEPKISQSSLSKKQQRQKKQQGMSEFHDISF